MVRRVIILIAVISMIPFLQVGKSEEMEISEAPSFVLEGENLKIRVTCGGEAVPFADVYLEREGIISLSSRTNGSGYAEIPIPDVNFSVPCKLKVMKEGYGVAERDVWIMDRPRLHVVAPKVVEEGSKVEIRVVDDELRGVCNAILSIDGEEVLTNETGCYLYNVPEVGFSTYLEIDARKEGYEEAEQIRMWIADNRSCKISAPLYVYEGEQIEIVYRGENGASISFGERVFEGKEVKIKAPHLNETRVYLVKVYDDEGKLLDYKFMIVLDRKERSIILSPYRVFEDSTFNLSLFSLEDLQPISNAKINFMGNIVTTDERGNAELTTPAIDEDYKLCSIEVMDENISCETKYLWIEKPAEEMLIIEGPSVVEAGENVTYNITDINGARIFAILYIGNTTVYAFNGSAVVRIPYTNESRYLSIIARSPGYLEAEKMIYVIGKEKSLVIDVDDTVREGEDFQVEIKDQDGNGVGNAVVWFNFKSYHTDENGRLSLLAPDVLLTTRYLIFAEKEGYRSASRWITIQEVGIGKRFMKIISPLSLNPGQAFEVKVIDADGEGIGGVDLTIEYGGIKKEFKTDEEGYAWLVAPSAEKEDFMIVSARKERYIEDSVMIRLLPRYSGLPHLMIYPSKTSLMEGEDLIIQVKDDGGEAVEGADVWIDGHAYSLKTDTNGIVALKVPDVKVDRSCFIYATKDGYNFGYAWIRVMNRINLEEHLSIEANDTVREGEKLIVRVRDLSGNPLPGARVWFNYREEMTNSKGEATFTAPSVEKDTYFLIAVESEGYAPSYRLVKVMDVLKGRIPLNISAPPAIFEGETIDLIVRDAYGYIVDDALVMVNGDLYGYTDEYGRISLKIPEVDHDTIMEIVAAKPGYLSAHTFMRIKDRGKGFLEENWFLIPFVIIVTIIAFLAYLYYRQYII